MRAKLKLALQNTKSSKNISKTNCFFPLYLRAAVMPSTFNVSGELFKLRCANCQRSNSKNKNRPTFTAELKDRQLTQTQEKLNNE